MTTRNASDLMVGDWITWEGEELEVVGVYPAHPGKPEGMVRVDFADDTQEVFEPDISITIVEPPHEKAKREFNALDVPELELSITDARDEVLVVGTLLVTLDDKTNERDRAIDSFRFKTRIGKKRLLELLGVDRG